MSWLRTLSGTLARVEEAFAGILLAAIVLVIVGQVLVRRLLGFSLLWSEEFCTYSFIALTLIGAGAATHHRLHVRLTLLLDRLPDRAPVERFSAWLLAAVLAGLVPGTAAFVMAVHRLAVRSPALQLPMSWLYALVPLALALYVLHLIGGVDAEPDTAPAGPAPESTIARADPLP
ncbi:MAG: TRAP transporter small permease [Armatimonadota bacterium]